MEPEICNCGEKATWIHMPSSTGFNPYFCDTCVPRGCSCNNDYVEEIPDILNWYLEKNIKFRIVDRKINGEESPYLSHKIIIPVDDYGREYPCCEFCLV